MKAGACEMRLNRCRPEPFGTLVRITERLQQQFALRTGTDVPFQEMGNVRCNIVEVGGSQSAFIGTYSTAGNGQLRAGAPRRPRRPKRRQSSAPPLTPMPQAPAPQHNAHLYSDQNYAKPMSGFPKFIAPYTSRHVPATEPHELRHDGQAVSRRQDLSVDQ